MIRILTSVIEMGLNGPPANSPQIANYVVTSPGSGDWLNHDNKIARTENGGSNWTFIEPDEDSIVWVIDQAIFYIWQGNTWVAGHSEVDLRTTVSGLLPQVVHDVSLPEEAIVNFVGDCKLSIDASITISLHRPENVKAADVQQIKTGDGALTFSTPGRIVVTWFGVKAGTATQQNELLTEACQALQDAGGGHLYFPPGRYRLFNQGEPSNFIFIFQDLSGIAITGYGTILELDPNRVWQDDEASRFFTFINCSNIIIDGFEGTGPILIQDGKRRSVIFSTFQSNCSNVRIPFLKLQGWMAAVIVIQDSNDPLSREVSRGFTLGHLEVKDCLYGVNFQRSGYNTTIELLQTENVYRSFFIYGTENIEANIISHNPKGRDVNMSAVSKADGNYPLRNIKVKYTNTDSNDSDHRMAVWLYFGGHGSPGLIENIDLDITIRYGDPTQNPMGAALWISKMNDDIDTDLGGTRGHIFRNVRTKALLEGDASDAFGQGKSPIRTQNGCDWTGETWSNVIFEEITVLNNTNDTSIVIDPRANTDVLTFRNVVLPGALNLWGSSSLAPTSPVSGRVVIDSVQCSNLNQYADNSQAVQVIELLQDQYTLPIGWQGLTISNPGAVTTTEYNLPPAIVGLAYSFVQITSNYSLRLDPQGNENIRGARGGRYLSLDSQGCFVTLHCYITGAWEIVDKAGLTSFEPGPWWERIRDWIREFLNF